MQSAAAIDEIIIFEAGPSADDVISIVINITDDLVALEATESYIATLEILGTPASRIEIGQFPTTNVSVLDDDGRFLATILCAQISHGLRRICPLDCTTA